MQKVFYALKNNLGFFAGASSTYMTVLTLMLNGKMERSEIYLKGNRESTCRTSSLFLSGDLDLVLFILNIL